MSFIYSFKNFNNNIIDEVIIPRHISRMNDIIFTWKERVDKLITNKRTTGKPTKRWMEGRLSHLKGLNDRLLTYKEIRRGRSLSYYPRKL